MKFDLMVRARASSSQPIPEKHERFRNELMQLQSEWRGSVENWPPAPDAGIEPATILSLSKYFPKSVKGSVFYANRKYLLDEGQYDDHFTLEFNPAKIDYLALVTEAFRVYIRSFEAYRAQIGDYAFYDSDFDRCRQMNQRDEICRIHPVSFFDRELCRRAFRLSPDTVVDRLSGRVELAEVFCDGVLIVASSAILPTEEADKINESLMPLLV